jgi:hypothetical protein
MVDKRKVAAAAAVIAYIKQEEEIACARAIQSRAATELPEAAPSTLTPLNTWGLSGRQTQMQLRNMMQMKAFHKN